MKLSKETQTRLSVQCLAESLVGLFPNLRQLRKTEASATAMAVNMQSSKIVGSGNQVIWTPGNIYPSAKLGRNVSVGAFVEIGNKVIIGANSRIGANSFIPEGVTIGKNVFVGPHCCFTNDRFPPSPRDKWERTIIQDGASIGAGCVIRCGVTIGKGAKVGCGSVVTKNIPPGETWCGVPARKMKGKKK